MTNVLLLLLYASIHTHKTVTEWEGEVLEIARISRLDMSAYLCIASNGVPPSVSKRIKVSVDCEYACLMTYLAQFQKKMDKYDSFFFCLQPGQWFFSMHIYHVISFFTLSDSFYSSANGLDPAAARWYTSWL